MPKGRGGRCGRCLFIGRNAISYAYAFTYHLPLRVLLLPEGGEFEILSTYIELTLKKHLQLWSLEKTGWHIAGSDKEYDLSEVKPGEHYDTLFYKDRWTNENGLSQRLIVTFSFNYREYLRWLPYYEKRV